MSNACGGHGCCPPPPTNQDGCYRRMLWAALALTAVRAVLSQAWAGLGSEPLRA